MNIALETGWTLLESIGDDWRWRGLEHETPRIGGGAFSQPRAIPAHVPGSVYQDLLAAGEIADPNRGLESRHCEWVAARHWVYRTSFTVPEDWACTRTHLEFGGADPGAEIFLDGKQVGTLEDVGQQLRVELETRPGTRHFLVVALLEPPQESGQLGSTSQTRTLKPRMGYWWDFGARLIPLSLGAVRLRGTGAARLTEMVVRARLEADHNLAHVTLEGCLNGDLSAPATLHVALLEASGATVAQSTFTLRPSTEPFLVSLELPQPRLWQCNGLGEPHLYRCCATLEVDGQPSDTFETRFGVRQIEWTHNPGGSPDAAPYTLNLNGTPVFARGWNWVPCDLMTGRADLEGRMRHLLNLARDAGANLVRVNGVGGFESQTFYDLCDELGLMVWQEFPLSSSGLDNVPPSDAPFLERLERIVPDLIRSVRQHSSLVLWGGGNELTDAQRKPATLEHTPALQTLERLVREHDPERAFRPTSPLGPVYDLNDTVALERPDDLHDVHGPWHYRGVTDSYTPFNTSTALLHSEFGAQGASHKSTLERAMTRAWPMDESNPEVAHRGSWWLMMHRVREAFGEVNDLETYWRCSQLLQAQVVGYGVASNRRRAPRCSGALVWQLNEPWTNAHNTSAVDFDGRTKMAYWATREAFAPIASSLHFASHSVTDDALHVKPFVVSDHPWRGELRVCAFDLEGSTGRDDTVAIRVNGVLELPSLEWTWTDGDLCILRLELWAGDRRVHCCDTLFSRAQSPVFRGLLEAPKARLEVRQIGEHLHLENTSSVCALHVNVDALEDDVWLRPNANFVTLRPGERLETKLTVQFQGEAREHVALEVGGLNLEPTVVNWAVQA